MPTYQITVKFATGVAFMTYVDAPAGNEDILKDFFYQQFGHEQSDKNQYSIVNMEENPNAFIEALLGKAPKKITLESRLANKAFVYADKYQ
jgi:hypothetical protein